MSEVRQEFEVLSLGRLHVLLYTLARLRGPTPKLAWWILATADIVASTQRSRL